MTKQLPRRRWVITQGRLRISSDMSPTEIAERTHRYYGRAVLLDIPSAPDSPPALPLDPRRAYHREGEC